MAEDRIEVLVYRDPDEGDDVHVLVNGETVKVHEFIVDPGAGYTLSCWQANKRASVAAASPAAGEVLARWYDSAAANSPYVEDDRPWEVDGSEWNPDTRQWLWEVWRTGSGRRRVRNGMTKGEADALVDRLMAMADALGVSWGDHRRCR